MTKAILRPHLYTFIRNYMNGRTTINKVTEAFKYNTEL